MKTAAEALEEVLALEQKATPGTYRYSPWHVEEGEAAVRTSKGNLDWAITFASDNDAEFIATVVNFIRTHADTLRAALAQPQEGGAEECLRKIDRALQVVFALCKGEQKWVMSIPVNEERDPDIIIADALSFAARLLRATQSNGRGAGTNVDDKPGCIGPDTPASPPAQSAPAQEPVATLEAKVSTLLARALTTGYGSTEAIYALANLAREPLFAAPPPDEARELLEELSRRTAMMGDMADRAVHERIRAFLEKHK